MFVRNAMLLCLTTASEAHAFVIMNASFQHSTVLKLALKLPQSSLATLCSGPPGVPPSLSELFPGSLSSVCQAAASRYVKSAVWRCERVCAYVCVRCYVHMLC